MLMLMLALLLLVVVGERYQVGLHRLSRRIRGLLRLRGLRGVVVGEGI